MSFEKKTWEDRLTEFPKRRTLTKSDSSTEVVEVSRNEGDVFQEGDKFSATNMNDLEDRIDGAFSEATEAISDVQSEVDGLTATHTYELESTGWVSNPDSTTSGVLPYVYTIATTDYSNDSTPVWDIMSARGIPASANEISSINRVQYALFMSTGITLYATSAPTVKLTLRVRGS